MYKRQDYKRLFKTGDCVDLQLSVDPGAKGGDMGASHVRLLFSQVEKKPVCVLMRPVDKGAAGDLAYKYHSPVGDKPFDRVEVRYDVAVSVQVEGQKYCLAAAVPLQAIGLNPSAGMTLKGDLGFISSDAAGTINVARTYWANKDTNLVSDMPMEAWLYPASWGELVFE